VNEEIQTRLRALPQVDELVRRSEGATEPRWALVEAARRLVAERRKLLLGGQSAESISVEELRGRARELARPSLRRVINATGVVLHTNLGRAPLSARAVARVAELAGGYSNVELGLGARGRGSRHDHVRGHLAALCGAEDALIVNNGAAAVLVALAGLAGGREAVVSRGELVEIGGSFRIPEIMRAGGVRLVEVGTTNKTRRADYAAAIGAETAALLKVHRSNFVQLGFVEEATVEELASLGPPVIVDLGSGALTEIGGEPRVQASVAAGAKVVTFSGDKLLGGPQAGVLVGERAALAQIAAHPLLRAVRPDKLTLAALEATLEAHREGRATEELPALAALALGGDALRARAEKLGHGKWRVVPLASAVGGGALPGVELPSWGVALPREADGVLRAGEPPIIGRMVDDELVLDVRSLLPGELELCAQALERYAGPA
jgi:L-seryl-tRNA(Ser) seleniumtransferase